MRGTGGAAREQQPGHTKTQTRLHYLYVRVYVPRVNATDPRAIHGFLRCLPILTPAATPPAEPQQSHR